VRSGMFRRPNLAAPDSDYRPSRCCRETYESLSTTVAVFGFPPAGEPLRFRDLRWGHLSGESVTFVRSVKSSPCGGSVRLTHRSRSKLRRVRARPPLSPKRALKVGGHEIFNDGVRGLSRVCGEDAEVIAGERQALSVQHFEIHESICTLSAAYVS
jgi:hypothetical protein